MESPVGEFAFSLIELMVVIAIVALLAAVAVPSYKSYVLKSKASTIANGVNAHMANVITAYNSGGPSTIGNLVDGYSNIYSGGYVGTKMYVFVSFPSTGAFDPLLNGMVLSYVGTEANGVVTWTCVGGNGSGFIGVANPNSANVPNAAVTALNYFSVNGVACS